MFKAFMLGATLAATALVATAAPAEARDRYRHRGGDDTAIAIGAGLLGLAVGAAIASDGRRDRYDDSRRYNGGYYDDGYYQPGYRGSYYTYDSYPAYRGDYRRYDRYDRYRDDNRQHDRQHRRWHRRHGY